MGIRKKAVVVGGSNGIGLAISKKLISLAPARAGSGELAPLPAGK